MSTEIFYTVNRHAHNTDYICKSYREIEVCDACEKKELVAVLPAEYNAGEFYAARLCKACLLRLVDNLERPYNHKESFTVETNE